MPQFVQGLKLSEWYYEEAARPILDKDFPGMQYAAALIGAGSDVLGYDTVQSSDHHWGPRLLLFLPEDSYEERRAEIDKALRNKLPYTFRGYSTNFGEPDEIGVRMMREVTSGPVNHMIEVHTVRSFFSTYLGLDVDREIQPSDWLTFSEHNLLASTRGKVFHDGSGELTQLRKMLAYYPKDVWLYILAAQWAKISEDEAFVGRCGDVGDELGSRLIAAHIIQHTMKLCFMMERTYAPYPKWFGKAFSQLECASRLSPTLHRVTESRDWRDREGHLSEAYRIVAEMHNSLKITKPMETQVRSYHGRPYQVIDAGRFAHEINQSIDNQEVRELGINIGSVNQFVDCSAIIEDPEVCRRLGVLYQ